MVKKFTLIYLGLFVLAAILDVTTALMVKIKQPVFNETNPIYIATNSFMILVLLKIAVVGFIVLFMFRWYKDRIVYIRYMFVAYIVLATIGQAKGVYGNMNAFMEEPSQVQEFSAEQKLEHYERNLQRIDMGIGSFLFNILLLFFSWWKIDNEYFEHNPKVRA